MCHFPFVRKSGWHTFSLSNTHTHTTSTYKTDVCLCDILVNAFKIDYDVLQVLPCLPQRLKVTTQQKVYAHYGIGVFKDEYVEAGEGGGGKKRLERLERDKLDESPCFKISMLSAQTEREREKQFRENDLTFTFPVNIVAYSEVDTPSNQDKNVADAKGNAKRERKKKQQ